MQNKRKGKGNVHLVQIVHCKIKEGKGKENVHLVQIVHCKIKKRKKGKRKCTSGANSTLQNKRKKEREKKMYIWCKLYIAK